jgi:hypothetical protein
MYLGPFSRKQTDTSRVADYPLCWTEHRLEKTYDSGAAFGSLVSLFKVPKDQGSPFPRRSNLFNR